LTFYTRWGDWLAELSTLVGIVMLAWAGMGNRRQSADAAAAPQKTKSNKRTKRK
jgi:hypothetical protein